MTVTAASLTVPADEPLSKRVERFFAAKLGAGIRIEKFAPMADGHAGLAFGFDVTGDGRAAGEGYILKMAPVGVPNRGSTDVYRQAPLLTILHHAGLPVPRIVWASADGDALGAPFICMERLAGRTFVIWEPNPAFLDRPEHMPLLWLQAAKVLGALHRCSWQEVLPTWERPVSLGDELERWSTLLRHTEDPEWRQSTQDLHDRLLEAVPTEEVTGLIHGDYQPGNLLYADGQLTGIIDWDLAAIGPQGIDVGWLLTMADPDCWEPGWMPKGPPALTSLLDAYVAGGGTAVRDLGWYRSFAIFRLSSIAGLNLKLHRNGRRVDQAWERFVPSIRRQLALAPGFLLDRNR
ncbi:MAG: phosphotransferase family protein [Bradyrhizobium sp.]|nr:phosphotransferase family protein [Bradyrhizobium sp.]